MKLTINLLKKVTTLSVLGLTLFNLNVKDTQAQRPQKSSGDSIPLLSFPYRWISSQRYTRLYTNNGGNVSIERQLHSPIFWFNKSSNGLYNGEKVTLTSGIQERNNSFNTLRLSFGIEDNAYNMVSIGNPKQNYVTVQVYLDGVPQGYHKVHAGELKTMVLDLNNIDNIAIEVVCSHSLGSSGFRCSALYFIDAHLISMSASQLPPSSTPDSKPPVTLNLPQSKTNDEPKSSSNGNTLEELEENIKRVKNIIELF